MLLFVFHIPMNLLEDETPNELSPTRLRKNTKCVQYFVVYTTKSAN